MSETANHLLPTLLCRFNRTTLQLCMFLRFNPYIFMQIYDKWDEKVQQAYYETQSWEFSDFKEFMDKYGYDTNKEASILFGRLVIYYEGLGVLVKEGLLNIRLVALLIAGVTRRFWEKFEPIIEEGREYYNAPRWLSETEYLYNELMKYMEEHPDLKT